MKVYLIKASESNSFKDYKKYLGSPPQNIFSTAAATPENISIEMCDETMDMRVNYRSNADLICIFMSTPDALRAYDIAKTFRKKGKPIVFGGLHASFMQDEVLQHGDAVMIGETEGIWEELLDDFQNNKMKEQYQRTTYFDIDKLKPFSTSIIKPSVYHDYWTVVVGRGCNNACSYCTVHPFFKKMRFRSVSKIVEEIKSSGLKYFELHADNLTADREYAMELFTALKPLNIHWSGETTINFAEDEELLKMAAESGLHYLLVGLETPSRSALDKSGKGFINVEQVKNHIAKFHEYGIQVDSSFLFGFDEHTTEIFQETIDFVKEINLDSAHSVILIPFPGTSTFNKLEKEGRIITKDWSKYDGVHAVFQPKNMSQQELEDGAYWFYQQLKSINKMHVVKSSWF